MELSLNLEFWNIKSKGNYICFELDDFWHKDKLFILVIILKKVLI